jgi:hypothetical protein
MRIIKLALISFVFLFGIITLISLFIPSHIRLSKIIFIKSDKDSIFSLIRNKDEWYRWHPYFVNSADAQQTLGTFATQVVLENDSLLKMEWSHSNKKTIKTSWQLHTEPGKEYGTLQWYIDFHLSWYPWQKFGSLFYEGNYGRMMEQGLFNLKQEVEK